MDLHDRYRLTITTRDGAHVIYALENQAEAFTTWQHIREMIPRYPNAVTHLTIDRITRHGAIVTILGYYHHHCGWHTTIETV
jgi:hypothetical protein